MQPQILLATADGSMTVQNPDGVTYHSRHGAVAESQVVFIEAGLRKAVEVFGTSICILETGFGTGLNALLTMQYAREKGLDVAYAGLELFPIATDVALATNYPAFSGNPEDESLFLRMHMNVSKGKIRITDNFNFEVLAIDIAEFKSPEQFHLIYFDTFAPSSQPELWSEDVFQNMYESLFPGGILVTYCSKSIVRKAMEKAGFHIEKLPGPKGKREMVRAVKAA